MKFRFELLLTIIFSCIAFTNVYALESKTLDMFDKNRGRNVPVAIYHGKTTKKQVVIISHGYGAKNTEYSFIASALAAHGYFVVSIQHDLETDTPLPTTGTLFDRRKPFWERGVQNILFVMSELKKIEPQIDLSKVILIGHSNGGDMSMMFATVHPEIVSKVISLDSRRYPFPRNNGLDILRFGAIDDEPDEGVVPNTGIQEIYVKGALHIDLCDRGSAEIKDKIQKLIIQFLDR
jgi:predicted esterase